MWPKLGLHKTTLSLLLLLFIFNSSLAHFSSTTTTTTSKNSVQNSYHTDNNEHENLLFLDDFDFGKAALEFKSNNNKNINSLKYETLGRSEEDSTQESAAPICIHDFLMNRREQHLRRRLAEYRKVPQDRIDEAELRRLMHPRVPQQYRKSVVNSDAVDHKSPFDTLADNPQSGDVATLRLVFNTSQVMDDPSGDSCYAESSRCDKEDVITQDKFDLLKEALDRALDFLSPIKVQPVSSALNIGTLQQCGDITVPESWRQNGVSNADTALLVMMRPTAENVAGYASHCVSDQQGRPVLGHLNISPRTIKTGRRDYAATVIAHEVTHALGFSSSKFSEFIDENQQTRDKVIESGSRTLNGDTMSLSYMTTPKVKEFVNQHFDCQNEIPGAELEEYGTSGTAGSHWEQRVFYNEYMTGSIQVTFGDVSPVSPLTLAALVDSGWYHVDLENFANPLTWGKGRGCEFANGACSDWGTWTDDKIDGYFCTENGVSHCSHNRFGKGYCYTTTKTDLRDYYYHIEGTQKVGFMPLMDFCPVVVGYSNGDCRNTENSEPKREEAHGENWGEFSRCFHGDLLATGYSQSTKDEIKCYAHACGSGVLYIKVGKKWVKCSKSGGAADTILGYGGSLTCPPALEMCDMDETTSNYEQVEKDGVYSGTANDLIDTILDRLSVVPIPAWIAIGAVIVLLCCLCTCVCCLRHRKQQKAKKWKPQRTYDLRNVEMWNDP